jgi:hypothetical protein
MLGVGMWEHRLLLIFLLLLGFGGAGTAADESDDWVRKETMRYPAAEPFARAKFLKETTVYESTILHRLGPDSLGLSLVYPERDTLLTLQEGETAELLRRFVNDDYFREMLQIRTRDGKVGYVFSGTFRLVETFGDRGAILAIHMSAPYEYECHVESVREMRGFYADFLEVFPQSPYGPEARLAIVRLDGYLLQCDLPPEENNRLLDQIGESLSLLLKDLKDESHRETIRSLQLCSEAALDAKDPREAGVDCFFGLIGLPPAELPVPLRSIDTGIRSQ